MLMGEPKTMVTQHMTIPTTVYLSHPSSRGGITILLAFLPTRATSIVTVLYSIVAPPGSMKLSGTEEDCA